MTSVEFTESLAFEQLEPDPSEVTMHLTAQLLALFHNVYRSRSEPAFVATDFLPDGDRSGRLARGTAVMSAFAAHASKRKN